MAFGDHFNDWANNDQTVLSWMNHVDQKLAELHGEFFGPGSEPSRIPGDQNRTNLRDALMDTIARLSVLKAEFEGSVAHTATKDEVNALAAKLDTLAQSVSALQDAVSKVQAPPAPVIDLDALALKVASHLAASVSFKAE